ncbi:MAG: Two-component transcriptional response regulator, LuxR family, partial [uncultured Acidimicrobiales bacterium]
GCPHKGRAGRRPSDLARRRAGRPGRRLLGGGRGRQRRGGDRRHPGPQARRRGVRPADAGRRWDQGGPHLRRGDPHRHPHRLGAGAGSSRRRGRRGGGVPHQVHAGARATGRAVEGGEGRAGVLACPRRPGARGVPEDGQVVIRRLAAVRARAGGPPAGGPRPLLQGDRRPAVHRREDGGEPRAQHPRQAPPQPPPGAHPLRVGTRDRL